METPALERLTAEKKTTRPAAIPIDERLTRIGQSI
jgi:hypothetical protein